MLFLLLLFATGQNKTNIFDKREGGVSFQWKINISSLLQRHIQQHVVLNLSLFGFKHSSLREVGVWHHTHINTLRGDKLHVHLR